MAVKIRLVRTGAKGQPSYRVVVADERAARSGKVIEILGHYDPLVEPSLIKVDKDKVHAWIKKGAQLTLTVKKMLGKAGVLKAIDFSTYKQRAPKQKGEAAEAAPAPAVKAAKEEKKEAKPEEKKEKEAVQEEKKQ